MLHETRTRLARRLLEIDIGSDADAVPIIRPLGPQNTEFHSLAASTEDADLMGGDIYDEEHLVRASFSDKLDQIEVGLQTVGFHALERFAGRMARVVTGDATLRALCRFDDKGKADITFAESAENRRALRTISVCLYEDPEAHNDARGEQ